MDKNNNKFADALMVLKRLPLEVSYEQVTTWVKESETVQKPHRLKRSRWLAFVFDRIREN